MTEPIYEYRATDRLGRTDKAIRAYGSPWVDQRCHRAGPWTPGKAVMRFGDGSVVCVRTVLLRRVRVDR